METRTELTQSEPGTVRRVVALDGLRGLAVAVVVLFHAGHLVGGHLGVDLFFVLSGFLITGLLVRDYRSTSQVNLGRFWMRRARRLMPPLLVMFIAVCLYARLVSDSFELSLLRRDAIGTLFYVANWQSIFVGHSYWDLFSSPTPLEHTWSLAIEEQFYIVWPPILWTLFRFTRASLKAVFAICLGLATISETVLWLLFDPANISRSYQGTDTRGAAILFGAALATGLEIWGPVTNRRARHLLELLAGCSMVTLAVAWIMFDGQSTLLYRGGFLVTELATLFIVAAVSQPNADSESWIAKALCMRPLVWLGLISYGLYLWHWPILVFLEADRVDFDGALLSVAQIGLSLAIAAVSYFVVELPIRRNGLPKVFSPVLAIPAAVVIVLGVLSFSTAPATEAKAGSGYSHSAPGSLKVLVVGDSVGESLAISMIASVARTGTGPAVANRAFALCGLLGGKYQSRIAADHGQFEILPACQQSWRSDVTELKPDVTIVLVGGSTLNEVMVGAKWRSPCDAEWNSAYEVELTAGLGDLSRPGGRVVLATIPHFPHNNVAAGREWVDCANQVNRRVVESRAEINLVDLDAWICPVTNCRPLDDNGQKLRPDGLHFRGTGGEAVGAWFLEQVAYDPFN